LSHEISGPDGSVIKTESQPIELTDELKAELHKISVISVGMVKPASLD